ncbi:hydrogenase expression/formation protein HypE [Saccharopolyspora sp. HNM0983]|uniref:Hydrogenase expression/formation protein HypE n=1 Tax=Saccharopolyspora montiporae TaxID=2781240 RepID=A0A929BCV1_9PSEU|nr:hydrogenase expression/formation protein HypE [Saccharopolyspora sp. HNM0983]MBE9376030.1 hydrogenase expression/formation protein HypE [Saccharopolyspora sp. HNM0983]
MSEDVIERATIDADGWTCPAPLRDSPNIVLGHGAGGALSADLVQHLFLPGFGAAAANDLGDSAVLPVAGGRVALSTDSYVVKPVFFPGGDIGDLAVNGTVNDLAMSGARPQFLSTAFIVEEGTPLSELSRVARSMGAAAERAGVQLVTGDTKVVDSGSGDGIFVNTAGIGTVAEGVHIRPDRARPGDVVLVSGEIGLHGIAVLSSREGVEFGTAVRSDTAPLNGLVADVLATGADVRVLRDPTRGGLAASINEIAQGSGVGIAVDEGAIPVPAGVRDACGLLGLDPMFVANEGKLVAVVAEEDADRVLQAMRAHELGTHAGVIGRCVPDHPGAMVARTGLGATRVVDLPVGEHLPRIC